MGSTSDAVADGKITGGFGAKGHDGAGEVMPVDGAYCGAEVEDFRIYGVDCYGGHFDDCSGRAGLWHGDVVLDGEFAGPLNDEGRLVAGERCGFHDGSCKCGREAELC